MIKISLHAINSATKIIQMRWDNEYNPHKYLSNTPGGVQGFASQPLDPHWQASLIFILQVGYCVSVSIGWCRTQINILSLFVSVVFTLSAFFFSWQYPFSWWFTRRYGAAFIKFLITACDRSCFSFPSKMGCL
jgi:hypothetical protein